MVGVEEGREFRFRWDLYSQESTFPLVLNVSVRINYKLPNSILGVGLLHCVLCKHDMSCKS